MTIFDVPPLSIVVYDATKRVVLVSAGGLQAVALSVHEMIVLGKQIQEERQRTKEPRQDA